MESLSDTEWDVLIEGTGVQQSLLALALSRSDKKILHVDQNDYYGGEEAAFSLQEVDEWIERIKNGSSKSFQNPSLWKSDSSKLSFSRAYTITLSPQIIYTRSNLLQYLVSSKVHGQLEFQAVGNWWLYDVRNDESAYGTLKRLPNGREDIFQDDSIDNRAKRSLIKFLKFVIDYENQTDVWEPYASKGLPEFLASQFQLPPSLQTVILALTLSLESSEQTRVDYALPRIERHLTSMGVFGPGFGSVFPKWGGGAEIAQVACRAGAVGGGVYGLGTGLEDSAGYDTSKQVKLSNGETVKARYLARSSASYSNTAVSKVIAVISKPLDSLFESSVEGSPDAVVSVVVFPANTLHVEGQRQPYPVYIMAHSSDTGECPSDQSVLYASTLSTANSRALLEAALSTFLKSAEDEEPQILYKVSYEQKGPCNRDSKEQNVVQTPSLDLAFNDKILEDVEETWKSIMKLDEAVEPSDFLKFEERKGMNADDDDD